MHAGRLALGARKLGGTNPYKVSPDPEVLIVNANGEFHRETKKPTLLKRGSSILQNVSFLAKKRKLKDPARHTGIVREYLKLSNWAEAVVAGDRFNLLITFVICIAGVLVGVQTYDLDEVAVRTLDQLDYTILAIFGLEILFKILAEGLEPHRFLFGPEWRWNWFDLTIVVFCLPIWGNTFGGGSSIALLRLLRLLRVMKLIKKIPQLQMIVTGLVGGLKSIGYIVMLLFLVFYLYAVVGIFAYQENDAFHFRSLGRAILTLFRMATLEDWTDVMYINYYGCDSDMYRAPHFTNIESLSNLDHPVFCDPELSNPGGPFAIIYFVSFIVISAMVMLSLFIGAVTMAMTESMEEMKEAAANSKREKQLRKARKRTEKQHRLSLRPNAGGITRRRRRTERAKMERISALLGPVVEGSSGSSGQVTPLTEESKCWQMFDKLVVLCTRIVSSKVFQIFVTGVIFLAGMLVGIQTEKSVVEKYSSELQVMDTIVLGVFITELLLKFIAGYCSVTEFFFHGDQIDGWNVFDFLVVAGSLLPGSGNMLTILRLLRLLRVLKLVKALPELQVIVVALINGFSSISYIGVILVIVFYVFAILGMILFQKNDPWHFGTLHDAMITLFRCATLEDWTDVMYINFFGCSNYGYGDMPQLCVEPYGLGWPAVFYFVTFTVIGAMVLLTLFIGVVTTSMEEATHQQKERMQVRERVQAFAGANGVSDDDLKSYELVFDMLDVDGGGTIEEEELQLGLRSVGVETDSKGIKKIMQTVDSDGNGDIDLVEFIEFMTIINRQRNRKKKEDENSCSSPTNESDVGPLSTRAKMAKKFFSESDPNLKRTVRRSSSKTGAGIREAHYKAKGDLGELAMILSGIAAMTPKGKSSPHTSDVERKMSSTTVQFAKSKFLAKGSKSSLAEVVTNEPLDTETAVERQTVDVGEAKLLSDAPESDDKTTSNKACTEFASSNTKEPATKKVATPKESLRKPSVTVNVIGGVEMLEESPVQLTLPKRPGKERASSVLVTNSMSSKSPIRRLQSDHIGTSDFPPQDVHVQPEQKNASGNAPEMAITTILDLDSDESIEVHRLASPPRNSSTRFESSLGLDEY